MQQKLCAVIEHFTLANNLGIAFKVKFNLVTPKFEKKKSVIFFLTVQSIMSGDIFIMISKGGGGWGGGAKINLVKPEFEILILFGGILSTLFIMIRSLWNS